MSFEIVFKLLIQFLAMLFGGSILVVIFTFIFGTRWSNW